MEDIKASKCAVVEEFCANQQEKDLQTKLLQAELRAEASRAAALEAENKELRARLVAMTTLLQQQQQ